MKNCLLQVIVVVIILFFGVQLNAQEFISKDQKIEFYREYKDSSLQWNNGFSKTLSGDKLFYFSGNPKANHALITRASDGNMSVEWQTAPVQIIAGSSHVSLVWLAGINCNSNEQPFDLELNGQKILTFSTRYSKEWTQKGEQGSSLKFSALHQDSNADLFGYMFLTIPSNKLKHGNSATLKITGQNKNTNNWMMVFEYPNVLNDFQEAPDAGFFTVSDDDLPWPEYAQNFPVIASGNNNSLWMAVTERVAFESFVTVYKIVEGESKLISRLSLEDQTGIAAPAIVAYKNSCVVFFPVEKDNKWTMAYAFIDEDNARTQNIQTINTEGTSNISPSATVLNNKVFVAWESNAGEARGIYSCVVTKKGAGEISRISSTQHNSYNPAIITKNNGELFCAWDAFQENTADIWAAEFKNGKWKKEFRITSDSRIDRHASLAVNGNDLWIAWQAQSYGLGNTPNGCAKNARLNHADEQRIVVAKLAGNKLKAPLNLFAEISDEKAMFVRPNISFAPNGSLILTAREPINKHDGWYGVYWSYKNDKWSEKTIIQEHRGRWSPVAMACSGDSVHFAVQYDSRPKSGGKQVFKNDWRSAIEIKSVAMDTIVKNILLLTEPLQMPATTFSLPDKTALVSASFSTKEVSLNNENLKLYFGDLHEHTDISRCACKFNPEGHDLFANLRDIEKLDFCAITDHHTSIDGPIWAYNSEQTRNNNDEGRFVTFLAQEWSSNVSGNTFGYGHHNFIFLDPYLKEFINQSENYLKPSDIWDRLASKKFICIPHQLADWNGIVSSGGAWGNPPKDWNYYNEKLMPVAEIFQERGSYEYFGCPRQAKDGAPLSRFYLQDAWKRKIIIGVMASPDHGGGSGKTGVWAKELSRESIFKAIQQRHTFGTTGAKMKLFFASGNAIMGDKVIENKQDTSTRLSIPFKVEAEALTDIKEVVIFRNNKIIYKSEPKQQTLDLNWEDESLLDADFVWYYVRIHTVDDELAWSSPIWFIKE